MLWRNKDVYNLVIYLNQPWKTKRMTIAIISDEFVMVLFSISKISKDDRALINVLRQEKNWSSQRFLREFSMKNWAWTSVDRLLKKINSTGVTERLKGSGRPRSVRTSEFRKTSNLEELICSRESALHVYTKSVRNWKKDGHFTVVCSAHCTTLSYL